MTLPADAVFGDSSCNVFSAERIGSALFVMASPPPCRGCRRTSACGCMPAGFFDLFQLAERVGLGGRDLHRGNVPPGDGPRRL